MADLLYQKSVNNIKVPVVDDETGEAVPAASFKDALYQLYDVTGNVKIALSLGSGIKVNGTEFLVTITAEMINGDFAGPHSHQFVVFNQNNERLAPLFKNKVDVEAVI